MRISDWSSDVCSSDLDLARPRRGRRGADLGQDTRRRRRTVRRRGAADYRRGAADRHPGRLRQPRDRRARLAIDRKSVVSGKSVSVRVDLGGRRIIKKKNNNLQMLNHILTYDKSFISLSNYIISRI